MSLLDDTLRDARRPLVLRRSASQRAFAASGEAAPGDTVLADERGYPGELPWPTTHGASPTHEMQVPRDDDREDFRREGQSLPREASPPFGSGFGRLPAGDPLSAVMGAERPKSSAKNVGFSDVTVMGDSRTSELATGPEKGRSPGKVAAAAAGSESMALQSVVLPGSSEAEWSRARSLSMAPEGSTTMVSAGGETFLSRPPGRGAPSENPHAASAFPPLQAERTPDGNDAPPEGIFWHASSRPDISDRSGRSDISDASDVSRIANPARRSNTSNTSNASNASNAPAEAAGASDGPRRPAGAQLGRARDASPPSSTAAQRRAQAVDSGDTQATRELFTRPQPNAGASAGDRVPILSIGRIDVTVIAEPAPAAPVSFQEAFGDTGVPGFLACNYLKRL